MLGHAMGKAILEIMFKGCEFHWNFHLVSTFFSPFCLVFHKLLTLPTYYYLIKHISYRHFFSVFFFSSFFVFPYLYHGLVPKHNASNHYGKSINTQEFIINNDHSLSDRVGKFLRILLSNLYSCPSLHLHFFLMLYERFWLKMTINSMG